MHPISVIIIAKNESANIVGCIQSAQLISSNIIVADSGSTDNTVLLAKQHGATVMPTEWKGYGPTRNFAANQATHDWIFALDADERITPALAHAIGLLNLTNPNTVYGCRRSSFLMQHQVKYGEWGRDKVFRLYHKHCAHWNTAIVHENLAMEAHVSKQLIDGNLLHYTMADMAEYQTKTLTYAKLSAEKYAIENKRSSLIKRYVSPLFSFVQNYLFRLGFLDGKAGWVIAYTSAKYVYLKYYYLHQLYKK
jgi:glycosyltransferase involved in cell wall biosynthesis